jgi:heterodisulfide reductase subunit A-like polyferredoxin
MMTNLEGVFTAGDVRRGTTFFVVDAVGEGHQAAQSIIAYLEGSSSPAEDRSLMEVDLSEQEVQKRVDQRRQAQAGRTAIQRIPVPDRENNFAEVELALGEKEAKQEAGRCLSCGPCSECLACLEVCEPEAILHHQQDLSSTLNVIGRLSPVEELLAAGDDCLTPLLGVEPLAGAAAGFEILKANHQMLFSDLKNNEYPPTAGGDIGLVVCQCGGEISQHLDTTGLCVEVIEWPEIQQTMEISSACSPEGSEQIKEFIQEHQLGKVILAACSCCSLDQVCYSCTYQRIRCKGNLGVYSDLEKGGDIDFVNIREGCAFLYPRSRKKATHAAQRMISAALGRSPAAFHPPERTVGFPPVTLVVGKGESAEFCQAALSEVGYQTHQVEVLSGPIIRSRGKFMVNGDEQDLLADCLVLAPTSGAELDYISRSVQLTEERPLLDGKDPEDARRLGIFICLPSLEPSLSGRGAAGEVLAWAGKMQLRSQQPTSWVDPMLCRSCGTCLDICGLGIPDLVVEQGESQAWINPMLCQDCGTCAAHCPSGAIQPGVQTDRILIETLKRVIH